MGHNKRKVGPREQANNRQQAHPHIIKLPRAIVGVCTQSSRRSDAFSYTSEHEGQTAIIYATNDDGTLYGAFQGIIDRVSRKGSRQFALRSATPVNPKRWQEKFGNLAPVPTD